MYVTVVDRDGSPVKGLTPADFIVREDGIRREVLRVEPATAPIEITILLDNSDLSQPFYVDMRRALTDFVGEMSQGNEIGMTTFGGNPEVLSTYTSSRAQLDRAIGRLFPVTGTGTYLLDALSNVAREIGRREPGRPVVLVILGQRSPEFSDFQPDQAISGLLDCGARFDVLVVQSTGGDLSPARDRDSAKATSDRDHVLDQVSRRSGGVDVQVLSSLAIAPRLRSIASCLRNEYLLVYSRPESLIPPRTIEVAAARPGLTARGTPVKVYR
jgi:VWFA-related protein